MNRKMRDKRPVDTQRKEDDRLSFQSPPQPHVRRVEPSSALGISVVHERAEKEAKRETRRQVVTSDKEMKKMLSFFFLFSCVSFFLFFFFFFLCFLFFFF